MPAYLQSPDPEDLQRQALMAQLGQGAAPNQQTPGPKPPPIAAPQAMGGSAMGKPPGMGGGMGGPRNSTMPVGPGIAGPQSSADLSVVGQPQQPRGRWGANAEWEGERRDIQWGDPGRMTGFNTQGWGSGERGTASKKNTFGQIASRYDPGAADALDQLFADPDFQYYFPDARIVDGTSRDKVDLGDGMIVDVLRAFGTGAGGGGDAWAFQGQGGEPTVAPDAFGIGGGGVIPGGEQGGDNALAQIIRQIQALQAGDDDPMQRDAIMALMGGQV